MGNPFKSNPERGVYRSRWWKTWQLVLSKDDKTGAMCVRIDPTILELFTQRFGKPIATVILCHPRKRIWNVQID
jgi:hypothetical protein